MTIYLKVTIHDVERGDVQAVAVESGDGVCLLKPSRDHPTIASLVDSLQGRGDQAYSVIVRRPRDVVDPIVVNVRSCARCRGGHSFVSFAKLTRPFAPPETVGLSWTHWASCPTNGEPILLMVTSESTGRSTSRPRMYARLVAADGRTANVGELALVEVPDNCTVHSDDAARLSRTVDLCRQLANATLTARRNLTDELAALWMI